MFSMFFLQIKLEKRAKIVKLLDICIFVYGSKMPCLLPIFTGENFFLAHTDFCLPSNNFSIVFAKKSLSYV